MRKLKEAEIISLSAETGASLGTVRRWATGGNVIRANATVLSEAAKKLGIKTQEAEDEDV